MLVKENKFTRIQLCEQRNKHYFSGAKFRVFWSNSHNSLSFIPAKYDTFLEADIETIFMSFSIFLYVIRSNLL